MKAKRSQTMKPEQQRITTAEACGFTDIWEECTRLQKLVDDLILQKDERRKDARRLDFLCHNPEKFGLRPQYQMFYYGEFAKVPDKREGFTDFRQIIDEAMERADK